MVSTASAGAGDAERLLLRHGPLYECWSLSRHCCQTFETATPKLPGCDGVVARSLFGLALMAASGREPGTCTGLRPGRQCIVAISETCRAFRHRALSLFETENSDFYNFLLLQADCLYGSVRCVNFVPEN